MVVAARSIEPRGLEGTSKWDLRELGVKYTSTALKSLGVAAQKARDAIAGLTEEVSGEDFRKCLGFLDDFVCLKNKIEQDATLRFREKVDSKKLAKRELWTKKNTAKHEDVLASFKDFLWRLPDKDLERLIEASGEYKQFVIKLVDSKPYRYASAKDETARAVHEQTALAQLKQRYDTLRGSAEFILDGKSVSFSEILKGVRSNDATLRKRAYEALLEPFGAMSEEMFAIYKEVVLDWRADKIDGRGYPAPISPVNLENQLSDKAVEAMMSAYRDFGCSLVGKYFSLKAQYLGLKPGEFVRTDIYAPTGDIGDFKVPFHEADEILMEAFGALSPELVRYARDILGRNHLHNTDDPRKESGAFCWSEDPSLAPYVFMSYIGDLESAKTFAHEMGHGVHAQISRDQPHLTYFPSLALAETASIFAEGLFLDGLVSKYPEHKVAIAFTELDNLYATLFRQLGFTEFEIEAHDAIAQGATIEDVREIYMGTVRRQFGGEIDIPEGFKNEFGYVTHFYHTPFYCMNYAIGALVVLSLSQRYREDPGSFRDGYLNMLAAGGSVSPRDGLLMVDPSLDIEDPDFWRRGFLMVEQQIDALAAEINKA